MTRTTTGTFLCMWLLTIHVLIAQTDTPPDARAILAKVTERFNEVKDYSADLTAEIHFEKMRFPRMEARIHFRQPDKLAIEPKEGSFAMIPRDAVSFNPNTLITKHYDAVFQGRETVGAADCYKVKLLATSDTIRMQRLQLYVDPEYWIVRRVRVTPERGSDVDVMFHHRLVQGRYMMWDSVKLAMEVPSFARRRTTEEQGTTERQGYVVVRYRNYLINRGIPDEIFRRIGVTR